MTTSTDSPLQEYLAQDLVLAKLRLNEQQRTSNKFLALTCLLLFLLVACAGAFSATVIFLSREHTRQIEVLFQNGVESSSVTQAETVSQEGSFGDNATINNRNKAE